MRLFCSTAILAVSVAGLGMVGMFWLGSWMSQVMKALATDPEAGRVVLRRALVG